MDDRKILQFVFSNVHRKNRMFDPELTTIKKKHEISVDEALVVKLKQQSSL